MACQQFVGLYCGLGSHALVISHLASFVIDFTSDRLHFFYIIANSFLKKYSAFESRRMKLVGKMYEWNINGLKS